MKLHIVNIDLVCSRSNVLTMCDR